MLRPTIFDVEITTGSRDNFPVIPTCRSVLLCVSPSLVAECDVLLYQKIKNTRPVVDYTLSVANHSSDIDTAHVSASPPGPIAELTPAERAEIELRRDLSLPKVKALKCVNLDYRWYVRSIWSDKCPKLGMVTREHPSAHIRSFGHAARLSCSMTKELTRDAEPEVLQGLRNVLKPNGYFVICLLSNEGTECCDALYEGDLVVMHSP